MATFGSVKDLDYLWGERWYVAKYKTNFTCFCGPIKFTIVERRVNQYQTVPNLRNPIKLFQEVAQVRSIQFVVGIVLHTMEVIGVMWKKK